MKPRAVLSILALLLLAACGPSASDQVAVAELPDPLIYALTPADLPDVGLSWQQVYNQTTTTEGYKWTYLAYQAYQPGNLGVEMESAFAVNNDVVLYSADMRRADLPQPPTSLGNIQNISWRSTSLSQRLGDKSAVWKTSVGEMLTPIWWLEFYKGHAYVRISLLGFPDQIAPSYLYGLGDIVLQRLPRSVATLRSDAATVVPTVPLPTATLLWTPTPNTAPSQPAPAGAANPNTVPILAYSAPPGQTGMVSFFDDTGNQLSDGVIGSDDILADLGNGTAYEWLGWTEQTDPITLTFTLPEGVNITGVQIGFNHREGLAIFVPASVTINGLDFDLQADAVPNNQRAYLTFTGSFTGPHVEIVLHHRGCGWILVDEVKFLASP